MTRKINGYKDNLDYLKDEMFRFELILKKRICENKIESLTEGGDVNDDDEKKWKQVADEDKSALSKRRLRNLNNRLKKLTRNINRAEKRLALKIKASRNQGFIPALVQLVEDSMLSADEKNILIYALAPSLERRFSELMDKAANRNFGQGGLEIDSALHLFWDSLKERIMARKLFCMDSRLVKNNLILLDNDQFETEDEFLSLDIRLPRRVHSLILGEHAIDESLIHCSRVSESYIPLDQVVIPEKDKKRLLNLIIDREKTLKYRKRNGFEDLITYGRGAVILFSGQPGTGKTMLARAVANYLEKRILLVDLQQLHEKRGSLESNIKNVFREAVLQNAILFFDECEFMFADRKFGNVEMTTLLREFEQFEGVAILATNLPVFLDEAMDRRIMLHIEFSIPTPEMRERIWKNHIPEKAAVSPNVDFKRLSNLFDFSGGYIKNSVLSAIDIAVSRDGEKAVLCHDDFEQAAKSQIRQRVRSLTEQSLPMISLDSVVLPQKIMAQVHTVLDTARHRKKVFDEWGFKEVFPTGRATSVLIIGPPGTGKTLTAQAVAFELNKCLYTVHLQNLISKWVGESAKNIASVFKEAKEADAVLFFDEADAIFSKRTDVVQVNDRHANQEISQLLVEIEKYDGVVIMASNLEENIDPAFERRFSFILRLPHPKAELRTKIWEVLLPEKVRSNGNIEFEHLGKQFNLTGGQIKNAILKAAFLAANNSETGISYPRLLEAAEAEADNKLTKQTAVGFV